MAARGAQLANLTCVVSAGAAAGRRAAVRFLEARPADWRHCARDWRDIELIETCLVEPP